MAKGIYNTTVWQRLRLLALQRDHFQCQYCKRDRRTPIPLATEVHHMKTVEARPDMAFVLDNLVSLCWDCHEKTKHKKEPEYRARVIKA